MNAGNPESPQGGSEGKPPQSPLAEEHYHLLFDCLPDGVFISDAEGRCLDANATLCRVLGYTRNELVGLHASHILAPSQAGYIGPALNELRAKTRHHGEWQFQRKDGSSFNAEVVVSMVPDGNFLGTVRDITTRKQAEAVSNRLAAIVESSFDAIISEDANNIITSWNQSAERIFGYSAGEMIGTSVIRLIPPERQEEKIRVMDRVRHGEKISYFETQRKSKDGKIVNISMTISPIKDGLGNIVGASTITRDITLVKSRESEILRMSRLYAALAQINQAIVRLATRDELFQKMCQVLVEHGGFRMAWIAWHDPETHRLVPVASWGDESGYSRSLKVYGDDTPESSSPTVLAFRSGRSHVLNDTFHDPETLPWRAELERCGFRASAVIPIRMEGNVCATLHVYSLEPGAFHDKEIILLEKAAEDMSFALDQLLREDMRRKAEDSARNEKILLDVMIENMPGVLYFCNEKGHLLRWNRNLETVSGYSHAEIARMHALDFFAEAEKPLVAGKLFEVFETGNSFSDVSLLSKDGKLTLYFLTGSRAIYNGTPCLVGMGIDISGRKPKDQPSAT
jgi:PAS domain S-box-containing protein